MNKFLIVNPFGIGDVLFTMPVVRALKDRHPGCFIGYWCNERVGELLEGEPGIDKIFPLSRGDIKKIYKKSSLRRLTAPLKLINEIRKEKFDVAFDFSLDSRYGLWSMLAGIKKRIGLDYKERGRFLTDKIKLTGYSGKHVVEHNLDLLNSIDSHCSYKLKVNEHCSAPLRVRYNYKLGYKLEVNEKNSAGAKKILAEHGIVPSDLIIGIAPGGGASWGKDAIYKQWPAEKFAEVAGRAAKELNAKIVLLGSADEKPLAENVKKNGYFVDLAGKLNLKELAGIISLLRLLICNDGGPLHMAAALGVKTVSLFGPVDEKVYGPYPQGTKHIIIKKDLPCRPCYRDFRFASCPNNRKCLMDITVEEVLEKAKQLI